MAWEDGRKESVLSLIEAANVTKNKDTKRMYLNQALSSAECIKDSKIKADLIKLIKDKLNNI